MQSLAVNGYTAAQVQAALLAPSRTVRFRYSLLDQNNNFLNTLTNITECTVTQDTTQQVRRTGKVTLEDQSNINFLSQRIQPWMFLKMPASAGAGRDGSGYAGFPLGVFMPSTPPLKSDAAMVLTREVDLYDLNQVLLDDVVTTRYTVTAGTNYISAVASVLNSSNLSQQNLTPTSLTLPTAKDWDPGTPKLQIVNDLLLAINYRPLYFDEWGTAVAVPYQSPAVRAADFTYADDQNSVIFPEDFEDLLDLFAMPNEWVLVVSESDRPALTSTYTNSNANSPTSTVNRGRTIVKYVTDQQAPDQATLDSIAQKMAFEDSQVYEQVTFFSALMPMHQDFDVLQLDVSFMSIDAKFSEIGWEMELKAGGKMKHIVQQVVSV